MTKNEVTLEAIKADPQVQAYLRRADETLKVLNYTEHGPRHAELVSNIAKNTMIYLGRSQRLAELSAIAGYLHDVGNLVLREYHPLASALFSAPILEKLGMDYDELALVLSAMGNHEEDQGEPVNEVAAAVILADKTDVHRSRVRDKSEISFDIHDRVNYAVTRSFLATDAKAKTITLELETDPKISSVMEYFEIFLSRMLMVRRASLFLGCTFHLVINGNQMV
ncbi:MAG: phosphohydrolase [bacterium]|nr:phosphohydrolase [bacterium]